MPIVFARIDDRLIHGQIIEAWMPYHRVDSIIVIDDGLKLNPLKKTILSLTIPDNIKLSIEDTDSAHTLLLGSGDTTGRTMVLFPSVDAFYHFYRQGKTPEMGLSIINIGNIHKEPGNIQVTDCVSIDNQCLDSLREMEESGLHFEFASLPRSEVLRLDDISELFVTKASQR